ncbi:MAG: ABC transporter substrate-binding protein [Rickettsia endosymbiont of Argas persicus]
MQKIITGLFLLIMTFSAYSEGNVPAGLNEYVNRLVNEASGILNNDKLSETVKVAKAQELMRNNLDFTWMAKYALGRYGNSTLSQEQIQEFIKTYPNYLIKTSSNLIKDYKGATPKIISIEPSRNPNEFNVVTNIVNNNGSAPIEMRYQVRKTSEGFKVFDIITENVSFIQGQQEDFTNTLKNQGFDALMQSLKSRS